MAKGMRQMSIGMAMTLAVAASLVATSGAAAANEESAPVQVEVEAAGADGVAGIALLSPAATATAVQLLAIGAPAGTSAMVHPGRCDAIDATLVALLGDVGATGQVQTTIPVPFETLTDGSHVIVLHPGLDLSTALGCGGIPATDGPVEPPAPAPIESPAPFETPVPIPTELPPTVAPVSTADTSCPGVQEWIAVTIARLDQLSDLTSEADRVSARMDIPAYLAQVATIEGHLQDMIARQSQEPVPELALEANRKAISGYEIMADAARQIIDAFTFGDTAALQGAVDRNQEGQQVITDVRRDIGQLQGRCASP